MAAEPVPEPDLDTLARHVLPGQIAGVSYGVSLVHADTQALRQEMAAFRAEVSDGFGKVDGRLARVDGRLARVDEHLAEILLRLPAAE